MSWVSVLHALGYTLKQSCVFPSNFTLRQKKRESTTPWLPGTPEPGFLSMVLKLCVDNFEIKIMHGFETCTLVILKK